MTLGRLTDYNHTVVSPVRNFLQPRRQERMRVCGGVLQQQTTRVCHRVLKVKVSYFREVNAGWFREDVKGHRNTRKKTSVFILGHTKFVALEIFI